MKFTKQQIEHFKKSACDALLNNVTDESLFKAIEGEKHVKEHLKTGCPACNIKAYENYKIICLTNGVKLSSFVDEQTLIDCCEYSIEALEYILEQKRIIKNN